MTSKPSGRRFTLMDGMILVASTAAGVAMIRACWGPGVPEPIATLGAPLAMPKAIQPWSPWIVPQRANGLAMIVVTLLVAWTPALLILRLRRPRPGLRRLMIRPGSAAIVLASAAL